MESITKTEERNIISKVIITNSKKANSVLKMNFYKIVFIYMLGGIVGTLWETGLNFFNGYGLFIAMEAFLPLFNFVYGCGAIIIIGCLHNQKRNGGRFLQSEQ